MRICSGISYVLAYSIFVMLNGSPSHHHLANAASTTEDHDLQTKVLLHRVLEKIDATSSTAKVKPVEGVLSEEEEKEVEPSQNTNSINLPFKSNHGGHDGAIPFETNGAGHDAAMQHSCIQNQNPKAKFWSGKTKVNKKGQIRAIKKQCKWLEKAGTWKINKFCGLTDSFDLGWASIPPAKNVCFETCNSCQTSNPTSSPIEDTYDRFVTTDELKDAVSDYCGDPEEWTTNPKYAKYGPIEEWDVSSIDSMYQVFEFQRNCNPNIVDWDVTGVTNFRVMFYAAKSFNQDIGGWDVSKGTYFGGMFRGASSFNQDIGGWDVSKGTDFDYMFAGASSFNQDIGGWDVSKGRGFSYMFAGASSFNQDIGGWDVSKGIRFSYMFRGVSLFNQDIGGWDVSKGTRFNRMFYRASSFNQDIGGWDVSNGTDFWSMFYQASSFNQDLCDWDIDDSASTTNFCYGAISCWASCSF